MKTLSQPEIAVPAVEIIRTPSRLQDYGALSKPRVTSLVLATTAAGMVLGASPETPLTLPLFLNAMLGSWLVIACANALNQVRETIPDGKMRRTAGRPLPSGRLQIPEALVVGLLWGTLGLLQLAIFVNPLTALLGAFSIAVYVFAYTPLKAKAHLCTAVGAIPGAIPPLAGWVAVRNEIGVGGVLLFAIQFFWQFPHFWAIAWLNREDYARAGFRMLPFPNAEGRETGLCAVQYSLPLIPLTLAFGLRAAHPVIYSIGAVLLTGWLVTSAVRFWREPNDLTARKLLKTTVMYLPLLLLLMIIAS